ncbi:MAG: hypothetical protein GW903_05160 [Alphaproteobacteria bacterium]|nr:hypothetical protein [Alphaproteobacteria bacterium]NCQ89022.1 hypothetical protein [Alphaproteobacteria bacterium]NCT07923.1 hypothetical protein [Alphaproteobacteria bacterium]
MALKTLSIGQELLRAASGHGGGNGSVNIPEIVTKMGTFAKAVAIEEYSIDKGFAFDSGLIFPLIGINHLITRGIMQPLERMASGIPDIEKGAAAKSTASVATDKPDSFFEDADKHVSAIALKMIKDCVRISTNVTMAEIEGRPISSAVKQTDLRIAEMALTGLNAAIQKLAQDNPTISGLDKFAADMSSVTKHYSAFAQKLLPTLEVGLKAQTPR